MSIPQQLLATDARYNNYRSCVPQHRTLYMRRRSQLLREKHDPHREQYLSLRTQLLSFKYPTVSNSDLRGSRAGSVHSRTCSMDSLDILPGTAAFSTPQSGPSFNTGPTLPLTPNTNRKRTPVSTPRSRVRTESEHCENYAFTGMSHIFDQHRKAVNMVLFAHHDSQLVACCSDDGSISLCQLNPCLVRATLTGHTAAVRDMDWSIDNSLLLSASLDGTARLWHVESAKCLRVIREGARNSLSSVRFQPMNNNICVGGDEGGIVQGYNLSTGIPLKGCREKVSESVTCLVFGPDGRVVWAADNKGHIYSIAIDSLSCSLKRLKCTSIPGGGSICSLSSRPGHPKPLLLVSSSSDLLFMFSIEKGDSLLLVRKCAVRLNALLIRSVFCPLVTAQRGACVVSGSAEGSVLLFDMEKGKAVNKLQGHASPVLGVCWSFDETLLVSSDASGTIIVWQRQQTGRQ